MKGDAARTGSVGMATRMGKEKKRATELREVEAVRPAHGGARCEQAKQLNGAALVEWRRRVVGRCLLARMSARQTQAEVARLAKEEGGRACGVGTVSRDMQAVREEWAAGRKAAVEELIAEELARLREMEVMWWERARRGGDDAGEAADRVLAIMRQRSSLLGLGAPTGKQSVQVTAGAMAGAGAGNGPLPAGAQVKVLVEYVDDRRELGL